jgi:DNA-binding beta-propeller fold protein YncE
MSVRAASSRSGSGQAPVRIVVGWLLVVALVVGVLPAVGAGPSMAQPAATDRPFERVGVLTLADGETLPYSAVIDPAGRFAYFGTAAWNEPGRVVKIDLTTFTRVDAITLAPGENALRSAVIDPAGRFAYFVTDTTPGRVVKVDLATFTRVGAIALPAGLEKLGSGVIDPAGRFAYFGSSGWDRPGWIVKIDLTTFEPVLSMILPAGENDLRSAVIDPAGRFAYFGTGSGGVVKIDLASFTRVSAVPTRSEILSALIEPGGRYAFVASGSGHVQKIDLSTFEVVATVDYWGNVDGFGCSGVIHPTGRSAYFGLMHDDSLVRVALPSFASGHVELGAPSADLLDLDTTESERFGGPCSAVIDPVGQYAYVGVGNRPGGRVVKVRVGPEPVLVTRLLTTYATTTGWDAHLAADVTGNGRADLLSYHPTKGRWWITSARRDGSFEAPELLTTYATTTGWDAHLAADVTGNGRADLLSYHPKRGRWWITSSRPDGTFEPPELLTTYGTTSGWEAHLAADVTGNGRADLLSYHPSKGRWWITSARDDGDGFEAPKLLTTYGTRDGWEAHLAADVTGNGRAELLSYHPSRGRWWLTASNEDGFDPPKLAATYPTRDGWEAHLAADVTGNGRADLLSFHPQQSPWFVSSPRADGIFGPQEVFTTYGTTGGWAAHLAADVSGNGRADLLSYSAARGRWWATLTVPG